LAVPYRLTAEIGVLTRSDGIRVGVRQFSGAAGTVAELSTAGASVRRDPARGSQPTSCDVKYISSQFKLDVKAI
jgi:hypothetical protein